MNLQPGAASHLEMSPLNDDALERMRLILVTLATFHLDHGSPTINCLTTLCHNTSKNDASNVKPQTTGPDKDWALSAPLSKAVRTCYLIL